MVARPRIFGPKIEKTVEAAAISNTPMISRLYFSEIFYQAFESALKITGFFAGHPGHADHRDPSALAAWNYSFEVDYFR